MHKILDNEEIFIIKLETRIMERAAEAIKHRSGGAIVKEILIIVYNGIIKIYN